MSWANFRPSEKVRSPTFRFPIATSVYFFASVPYFASFGHGIYEKRAPAFLGNLAHLVVGPLWVLNHFFHIRKERTPLAIENHV